jgi:hypothetical protein
VARIIKSLGWGTNLNFDCIPACSANKRSLLGTVSALGFAVVLAAGIGATPAAAKSKLHDDDKPKSKQASKDPFGNIPSGPLQIFISINQQKLHLYSNGRHVADALVATGVPGHLTPMGVFSVIEKDRYHHSNIYSGAPMPYMQRITWSGVALHEGTGLGRPASHGCIRMPQEFAAKLWVLSKLGARVIIARSELAPSEFSDARLFVHKDPPVAPVAVIAPAVEPVKTAQATDPTTANDAAPLQTTPAPATKSADADPSLIDDGKAVAEGAAAGLETEAAAPAATVNTETTGTIATAVPTKIEPALPVAAEAAPAEPPKVEATKVDPADAAPGAMQSPTVEAAKNAIPVLAPIIDFAARLRIPSIIASPQTAPRAPATMPAITPVVAETAAPVAEDIEPLPIDAVPMPEPRPANIAKILAERAGPVAVFISRKEGKIFVRQRFRPVFDAPITITNPQQPLGTHVFTAMEYQNDNSTFRWTAVTLPGEPPRVERQKDEKSGRGKHQREAEAPAKSVGETKPPQTAHEALARIQIPQDVIDRIEEMMIPGSSLVVSDQGLGPETGEGTDFIVVTR